jgi:hypothetical protein
MKKAFDFKLLALVAVLVMAALIPALAGISQGVGQTVGAVVPSGSVKDGNLPVWKNGTTIEDSTVSVVEVKDVVTSTNGPNQVLKLDENGKIGTNAIPYIIVIFTGGEYQQ